MGWPVWSNEPWHSSPVAWRYLFDYFLEFKVELATLYLELLVGPDTFFDRVIKECYMELNEDGCVLKLLEVAIPAYTNMSFESVSE
jgi:hypothetical protein